ncbi:hypothetical protein [Anaplasma phagocytophilum]|uniref:hypothetical protein n=1 Tax=Anaplasma phagocytophilum TaxID=948 RepID=UPI0007E1E21C|nr:hypothetical protein [Anaplasma phagocytophilum]
MASVCGRLGFLESIQGRITSEKEERIDHDALSSPSIALSRECCVLKLMPREDLHTPQRVIAFF